MDVKQAAGMLRWLSNVDARVMYTDEAVEMWAHSLAPFDPAEVKQAILDHYRTNENVAATFAGIRKRALAVRETRAAQVRAIEPPAPQKTEAYYRRRVQSPEFRALFEQGRREGNAERAYATVLRETGDRNQAFAARDAILYATEDAA